MIVKAFFIKMSKKIALNLCEDCVNGVKKL